MRKRMMSWSFIFLSATLLTTSCTASIIKRPPAKSAELNYKELPCTEHQKALITELITTMGVNSKLNLLFVQNHLKEIGDQINDVHPLKFLSIVFTDPELKMNMHAIWIDYFKRTNLMEGLGASLTREMTKGKLLPLVGDFATELGIPPENIEGYFHSQSWENLVLYLIHS